MALRVLAAAVSITAAAFQPEAPLAGPRVRERPAGLNFGLGGDLRRDTLRPEESILKTLDLDAASREAVDRVFNTRGRLLVRFIVGNIDLLNRLNVSGSSGDKLGTAVLLAEAIGRLQAMGFDGDVTGAVRRALPEGARGAFDRGMHEFWLAVAMEKTGKSRSQLRRGDVYAARFEESGKVLGRELEAAFQRAERSGEFVLEYLLGDVGLSEAQRDRIRGMVFAKMDGGDLSEEERNTLFAGVLAYLTPEQTEKVMKKIRGR